MKTLYQVRWAGQLCNVVGQTKNQLRLQFRNATGFCDMWINRAANLYYATPKDAATGRAMERA